MRESGTFFPTLAEAGIQTFSAALFIPYKMSLTPPCALGWCIFALRKTKNRETHDFNDLQSSSSILFLLL
jgi:hypothetical protein